RNYAISLEFPKWAPKIAQSARISAMPLGNTQSTLVFPQCTSKFTQSCLSFPQCTLEIQQSHTSYLIIQNTKQKILPGDTTTHPKGLILFNYFFLIAFFCSCSLIIS